MLRKETAKGPETSDRKDVWGVVGGALMRVTHPSSRCRRGSTAPPMNHHKVVLQPRLSRQPCHPRHATFDGTDETDLMRESCSDGTATEQARALSERDEPGNSCSSIKVQGGRGEGGGWQSRRSQGEPGPRGGGQAPGCLHPPLAPDGLSHMRSLDANGPNAVAEMQRRWQPQCVPGG